MLNQYCTSVLTPSRRGKSKPYVQFRDFCRRHPIELAVIKKVLQVKYIVIRKVLSKLQMSYLVFYKQQLISDLVSHLGLDLYDLVILLVTSH